MTEYGEAVVWRPERPRFKPIRLLLSWLLTGAALYLAAAILPGVDIADGWGALAVAAVVAALNAVLPPILAALRLPFMVALGFILVLLLNAFVLQLASDLLEDTFTVDSFGWALVGALVVAAMSVLLEVLFGTNDDDTYTLRVVQRIARRQGGAERTDVPGILFLEIDGLALPVVRRAMRDGNAPTMARWLAEGTHRLVEWEPDLSSQTGASQAGILLGSNEDIPAFRWVEKETGRLMTCSAPADCARIEAQRATGIGLLANGGSSRGNLLSGEADEQILTVSRIEAEKHANPGYRAFFANGFNVTRALVLFGWEVVLEWVAAQRAIRRDVRPRGHRGGLYPFMRAAMCVVVRDLIVYGVLTDMMRGRPAIYATVLSDHGQTQGATFKQRNGYGLDDLVQRSLEHGDVEDIAGGDEQHSMVGHALGEATGGTPKSQKRSKKDVSGEDVVVLGSGNLGLVYLMEEQRRLTLEEIEERHPRLITALREHPHIGWLLVRSAEHGPVALGACGAHYLAGGRVDGDDPLASFSPNAPRHLLRTDGFQHVADIMIGSFYDTELEEGCAFEELISFHGGIGGPQTQPFVLYPIEFPVPEDSIVGAENVHGLLLGWRRLVQDRAAPVPADAQTLTRELSA
jgi:uncharacterized membrane protein YvlD (DUF360 family)